MQSAKGQYNMLEVQQNRVLLSQLKTWSEVSISREALVDRQQYRSPTRGRHTKMRKNIHKIASMGEEMSKTAS